MIRCRLLLLVVAWTVCAAVGTASMIHYELTPGVRRLAPSDWPVSTQISRDGSRPTLLCFLHPQCPCSRATLAEMQRLVADCGGRFALHILLLRPRTAPADWEKTELYRAAGQMPAAQVHCDLGGAEAARFGALTSGEILLYASDGRLLYHGGLTASRGHEGDNAGRSALSSLIKTGHANCHKTPVFGCCLVDRFSTMPPKSHATAD